MRGDGVDHEGSSDGEEEDDEEAMQVFEDEGVEDDAEAAKPPISDDEDFELEAAATKPPSVREDVAALRSEVRAKGRSEPAGNRAERRAAHQMNSTHSAIQSACEVFKSSSTMIAFSAQDFMKELQALDDMKARGFLSETQYKAEVQEVLNMRNANRGFKVDQGRKKKKTTAANSDDGDEEDGE